MRKILSGFLATSMVVAMASTMSFAAVTSPSIDLTLADVEVTMGDGTASGGSGTVDSATGTAKVTTKITGLNVTVGGVTIAIPLNLSSEKDSPIDSWSSGTAIPFTDPVAFTAAEIQTALADKTVNTIIDGKVYNGKFVKNGANLKLQFDGTAFSFSGSPTLTWDSSISFDKGTVVVMDDATPTAAEMTVSTPSTTLATTIAATLNKGTGSTTADVEITGDFFNDLKNVIICDGNGNPLPMTEKGAGVDKDLNGSDGIQSDRTLYFMINEDTVPTLMDDNYWKIKVTKGDNAKIVKEITDTTKIFSSAMVNANNGAAVPGIDFTKRHRYIKVKLNELYTDDEYKVTLDMRISPTSKAETKYNISGDEIKVKDFSFWVKNIVKDADNEWTVGISGLMLNPVTNDWNEVTYTDEEGDVAFMKFFGDSDTGKFYAKLSTKWAHEDYAAYFNDQDAFYFEFTGSPKLSSTSRADLQIYNPFVDEDGNETIDPTTATIYQVVDGDLIDVTDSFTYGEGDNGDDAFITRTRFLGSYIICEKPVEEAVGDSDIDDLMPDDLEVPEDVTPDAGNNGGGAKQPANTGRYL